jgi:hypothetical protein
LRDSSTIVIPFSFLTRFMSSSSSA